MLKSLIPALALLLLVASNQGTAAQQPQPTATVVFSLTLAKGEQPSPDRRSAVGLRLAADQIWEGGTDFSVPLEVPAAGPVEMFLVPTTGVDGSGVGGAFKINLSAGGTVTVPVKSAPKVPVRLTLLDAEGAPIPRTFVRVYDVTYRDRGYTNENYVADSSASGEFSFYGFPGETYELRLLLSSHPQFPQLVFPTLTVDQKPINQRLSAPAFPAINFTFVQLQDGREIPLMGERVLTYKQDNLRDPQRLPLHNGTLKLLLLHDLPKLDEAKSLTFSLPGYILEPATIHMDAAQGRPQLIKCSAEAESKPAPTLPAKVPIVVNLTNASGEEVQGGGVVILKRDVNAGGHADFMNFTYHLMTPTDARGRFEYLADPQPFVGYLLYTIKVGRADAIYSQKTTIVPGTPCDLKISGSPRKVAITITKPPGTPERRTFVLVDARTYQPVSAALMRKDDPRDSLTFAAFPGKYRILLVREASVMQVLGDFEVKDSDPDSLAVTMDWSSLSSIDTKDIEAAQQADFSQK